MKWVNCDHSKAALLHLLLLIHKFRFHNLSNAMCSFLSPWCAPFGYFVSSLTIHFTNKNSMRHEIIRCLILATVFFPCFLDNGGFSGCFPHQESRDIRGNQPSWNEEQPQKAPATWNSAACVGSKVTHCHTWLQRVDRKFSLLHCINIQHCKLN